MRMVLVADAPSTPELPPATLGITIPPRPSRPVQLVGDVVGPTEGSEVSLSLRGDATVMLRPSETAEAAHRISVLPSARLTRMVSGSTAPRVRSSGPADRAIVESFLEEHATARVARLGELVDARENPALIAEDEAGVLAGVLTYVVVGDGCEILTLHVAEQWHGAGTALIEEVERIASRAGCRRVWLITTNDNVDALRFYQRRGFRVVELHPGEVDRSRESLKPEIPETGEYGIPIRDELELEKLLQP